MKSTEFELNRKRYRVDVFPYSDTDTDLVWAVYCNRGFGWDKVSSENISKALAHLCVMFYKGVTAREVIQ